MTVQPKSKRCLNKGDDLRKDQVVLQCFKIFDQLCLEESLNLNITAYTVLATGFKFGYLEFVTNKEDLVDVHRKYSPWYDWLFSRSIINNLKKIVYKDMGDKSIRREMDPLHKVI